MSPNYSQNRIRIETFSTKQLINITGFSPEDIQVIIAELKDIKPILTGDFYSSKSLPFARPALNKKRRTVVFDLDETLVHALTDPSEPAEFQIKFPFSKSSTMQVGVNVRPYAMQCLKECAAIGYQVVIFTASHQTYADAILDTFIDPKRIYPRLYRQHCTKALGF